MDFGEVGGWACGDSVGSGLPVPWEEVLVREANSDAELWFVGFVSDRSGMALWGVNTRHC